MSKSSTRPSLVVNAAVMATVSTVLPGFLIGALSVQVSAEMGVYVGVFVAPLVTGWLIENHGYQAMWLVVAASSVIGAAVSIRIANQV